MDFPDYLSLSLSLSLSFFLSLFIGPYHQSLPVVATNYIQR